MIEGFEKQTSPLTDEEKKLVPKIVLGLSTKTGKEKAITNKAICKAMILKGHKISGARVRKIINHIRATGLIKNLVASSAGYYIETNPREIKRYRQSLIDRAGAIMAIAETFVIETKAKQANIFDNGTK